MTPLQEQRLARVEGLLAALCKSDRYVFEKLVQFADGRHIQTGRTTGTKIATASDQLLGFYGATPVDRPATVSDPSAGSITGADTVSASAISTNFSSTNTAVGLIIDRLQELGLIA